MDESKPVEVNEKIENADVICNNCTCEFQEERIKNQAHVFNLKLFKKWRFRSKCGFISKEYITKLK